MHGQNHIKFTYISIY